MEELYLDKRVPTLQQVPDPLAFYRDYVSANKPVVVRGAVEHWPAVHSWTHDYLRDKIGSTNVTVAVTPDGYADAVTEGRFMKPAEKIMQFSEFLEILERKRRSEGIAYIQKQNSNFTDEFGELTKDVEMNLDWATEAFGSVPDAVNFWMGDGNAVTSMHKDHYENIYCVVSGQKTFLLIPPTDLPYVPYEQYKSGVYIEQQDGSFGIMHEDDVSVPWIAIDPLCPDLARYPEYRKARPIEVTVGAGDVLYLPSLWFHHVRQSHGCIAVNYWYDMAYDIRYSYYKFVESLLAASGDTKRTPPNQSTVDDESSALNS